MNIPAVSNALRVWQQIRRMQIMNNLKNNNIKALGRRMTMNNNKWPKWCGEDTRCDEVGEEGCYYLNDDGECIKTVKQAGDE